MALKFGKILASLGSYRFRLYGPTPLAARRLQVSDLVLTGHMEWNQELFRSLFSVEEVARINSICLNSGSDNDTIYVDL